MPAPNERLAELTREDFGVLHEQFRKTDPIIKLHEKLYGDPEIRREYEALTRKGVKKGLFPDATLPDDPREVAAEAMKPMADKIAALEAKLEAGSKSERHKEFRRDMVEAGAEVKDIEEIEKFMVDNEFGPKAMPAAVDAFYRTKDTATPNATEGLGFTYNAPGAEDDNPFLKQILGSGPGDDLTDLTTRLAEQNFREIAQAGSGRRGGG